MAVAPQPLNPFLRCTLAEGPLWDSSRDCLWWVDILPGHIHRFHPDTGQHHVLGVSTTVGTLALTDDGDLIAATGRGFARVDLDTGSLRIIRHPEAGIPTNRFNEGKPDPAGRFWAGTMSMTKVKEAGSLYTLERDGTVHHRLGRITISNGLVWTPDRKMMYYIDTPTRRVDAFDYEMETGTISNRRTVVEIPDGGGNPDGMSADTDGGLWVAQWGGSAVVRYDPETGKETDRITLPVERVSSCTFGGPDYRDLYITTAQSELTEAQVIAQPLAGCVFVVKDCGYQGYAPHRYAGHLPAQEP